LDEHTEPSPGGFLSGLEASRVQGYQESFGGNNMKYLQKAVDSVEERFPFNGYMAPWHCAYLNVAQTVLRHLPDRGSILDFASGPCDKTAVLQELGYACSAYDDLQDDWHLIEGNKENILSFAEGMGIDFKVAEGGSFPYQKNSFDMIMMHGVLEHLPDSPRDLLNDLLELAKPEGLLFVTVPNAVNIRKRISVLMGRTNLPDFSCYYWKPGPWRGHVREYVRNDLKQLADNLNLEILELRGAHHMLMRIPSSIRPAYTAITSLFPGWRDTWLLVARKRKDWVSRKTLPKDELAKIAGKYTSYQYQEVR